MKLEFISIILILTFLGCNDKKFHSNSGLEKIELNHRKYELSDIKSILSNVSIKPIIGETGETFSAIRKGFHHNDKYYLLDKLGSNRIVILDNDGYETGRVDALGHSPYEYVELSDFELDINENQILIYDFQTQQIKYYSTKGDFIKIQDVAYYANSFILKDSSLIFHTAKHENVIGDDILYKDLLISDYQNSDIIQSSYFPYNPDNFRTTRFYNSEPFFIANDSLFFNDYLNDSIYHISSTGPVPLYIFDYGTKALPDKLTENGHADLENLFRTDLNSLNNYAMLASTKFISDDHIFYSYIENNMTVFGVYDRNSKQNYMLPKVSFDINESILKPVIKKENGFYVSIVPKYVLENSGFHEINSRYQKFDSEHPFIVEYTLSE